MAALVASVSNRLRLANNIYNIEALSHSFRSKYLELSYVFLRWVQQTVQSKILELNTDTNIREV